VTDRRLTPANDRAALESLRGIATSPRFVPGEAARIALPLVDLCRAPAGLRDRQLLLGDSVTVIDRHDGWAFVQATKDDYCGYLPDAALGDARLPTHRVAAPATHLYPEARVQAHETAYLSFGVALAVTGQSERFAETPDGFVPMAHLRPLSDPFEDPVDVAELFLGTPYLWGGNSRAGIDCSGLVQAALLACGLPCPGDSDLQQALGVGIAADAPLRRGDLLFWAGHVAMMTDEGRLIHASGHVMATVIEPAATAIARIAATGKPVLARRRV
jgi:cell wall-associated NlpC family hydrolase